MTLDYLNFEARICSARRRDTQGNALSEPQQERPDNKWHDKIVGFIRQNKKENTDNEYILRHLRFWESHVHAALTDPG